MEDTVPHWKVTLTSCGTRYHTMASEITLAKLPFVDLYQPIALTQAALHHSGLLLRVRWANIDNGRIWLYCLIGGALGFARDSPHLPVRPQPTSLPLGCLHVKHNLSF